MELDKIYDFFNEEERLNTTPANRIEYLTTTKEASKYLKTGMRILDVGAATGAYSIPYANQGYDVTAVEPVEKNLNILKSKITKTMQITPILGNALDLTTLEDNSFDFVFCMGPLYHLKNEEERMQCINELQRVTKPNGIIFVAYISHDMVVISERMKYKSDLLTNDKLYNAQARRLIDMPFTFLTNEEMNTFINKTNFIIKDEFAQDGVSELFSDVINTMEDEEYENWLNFHYSICHKKEWLGCSNHVVLVLQNNK